MTELTHHDDLWYEDGNVVLVAESTAFCLHRSILSRKCPVFRDMFSTSHPDTQDIIDGRPSIHLSDASQDLAYFFDFLYNGMRCVYTELLVLDPRCDLLYPQIASYTSPSLPGVP